MGQSMGEKSVSTTLYVVRHGETEWHAENRYAGVSDVGLTETGREQAERLGRWAAGAGVFARNYIPAIPALAARCAVCE